jgi:hypothetical protein
MITKKHNKAPNGKKRSSYAITRIDSERHRTFAWIVTVQRRKRIWRQSFSDRSFGGKSKALTAAKAFRDLILRQHPPMTRAEYCQIKRRNNQSGSAGVCRYAYLDARDKKAVGSGYWLAFWTLASGKSKRMKFSIRRFGERGALKRAVRARKQAVATLDGRWVNSVGLWHWLRTQAKS